MLKKLVLFVVFFFFAFIPVQAQENISTESATFTAGKPHFFKGKVVDIREEGSHINGGYEQKFQEVSVAFTDNGINQEVAVEQSTPGEWRPGQKLDIGDRVVLVRVEGFEGQRYYFADHYRLPNILYLILFFIFLIILFTGKRGMAALVGLAFSVLVLVQFMVPQIMNGHNPLLISWTGALVIGCVSLYLAHGFQRRTTLALTGTLLSVGLAGILASVFVSVGKLLGMGSEEAMSIQFGNLNFINLRGILLGGMIIGALGVLDDITTAQVAAVEEIHLADKKLNFHELYERGIRVGKEHILSLVNTLALAYAGSSLPLLLLFGQYQQPLWVTLNSEFVMEEVVRTLVGSSALIMAVPITTIIAAKFYSGNPKVEKKSHAHSHH